MDLQVGTDLVEISRIESVLSRYGRRFLDHVYTPAEQALCRGRPAELAARFAAKEATMKALGTGRYGVGWREIEVLSDPRGRPLIRLHGRARARAAVLHLGSFAVSLSHERAMAVATVVAWGDAAAVPATGHLRESSCGDDWHARSGQAAPSGDEP